MKPILTSMALVLTTMIASAADAPAQKPVPPDLFQVATSFEAALIKAEHEHKIVFVDFYTTWCGPWKLLDKTTWQDSSVIALLTEKTIPLKIDAEKEVALAKRYGVDAYPSLVFIRPDGTLIDTLVGYREPSTFARELRDALAGRTKLAQAKEAVEKSASDPKLHVKARYDLGRELAQKGKNPEALTEYLWCFDVGMKEIPEYGGVRESFLLSDIAGMGAHYPPALDALKKRRDAAQKLILVEDAAASEYGALNNYLGENEMTLAEFDKIPANNPRKASFGHWVADQLLEAKRYGEVLTVMPLDKFRKKFASLISSPNPSEPDRVFLAEYTGEELEALAGAGKIDEARDLLADLLKFDHSQETISRVHKHLERAGHADLMPNQSAAGEPSTRH